ncbi:MAG TPA: cysteine--tRNA ligase [Candidatus Thermoplasmatota archaeon]|nr:cysteine--tRNA ligase [Candidatus Thermoplasmatota archaeon]
MVLRVMNTRTHRVEPFEPREPDHVRMYVCGPSVYDDAHLGHARSYVAYDAMKRYFLAKGMRVTHVQNFTDVEEHIAERARESGYAPLDFTERVIARFFADMDELRVLRADRYPRVSEHVPEILATIGRLQEKGYAYAVDCGERPHAPGRASCDVYFSVERAPDYGSLIGTSVEELTVERPTLHGDRKNPLDFALWKSRDDWGVTWESPYGLGRPGWHVECAAMSRKHLGDDFDVHGGGLDLVFPHHESERVIGEAASGKPYCRYYLHNGFVTVGNTKMSKSLGNFVTARQMLHRHGAEVVRTFLLAAHYRAPLNYDEEEIARAAARVARWRALAAQVRRQAHGHVPAMALAASVCEARDAFWAALEDDFRFDRALDALELALQASCALDGPQSAAALGFLREAGRAMGVLWDLE